VLINMTVMIARILMFMICLLVVGVRSHAVYFECYPKSNILYGCIDRIPALKV
jgi:hypothetical protein